jgi:hypothetical protein
MMRKEVEMLTNDRKARTGRAWGGRRNRSAADRWRPTVWLVQTTRPLSAGILDHAPWQRTGHAWLFSEAVLPHECRLLAAGSNRRDSAMNRKSRNVVGRLLHKATWRGFRPLRDLSQEQTNRERSVTPDLDCSGVRQTTIATGRGAHGK